MALSISPANQRRRSRTAACLVACTLLLGVLPAPAPAAAADPRPSPSAGPTTAASRGTARFVVRWEEAPVVAPSTPAGKEGAGQPGNAAAGQPAARGISARETARLARVARTPARLAALRDAGLPGSRFVRITGSGGAVYDAGVSLGDDPAAVLARLAAIPGVRSVEPDPWLTIDGDPDPRAGELWGFGSSATRPYGVDLEAGWAAARDAGFAEKGDGIVVGVLDTGILVDLPGGATQPAGSHPDLDGQALPGYDMVSVVDDDVESTGDGDGRDPDPYDPGDWCDAYSDSSWHGSHVAGIIAAIWENGIGVHGAAPSTRILPVRVLGRCGGYASDVADGIRWASGAVPVRTEAGDPIEPPTQAADIINLSLSGSGSCTAELGSAIRSARAAGVLVVVAAGNDDMNAARATPANCPGAFVVANLDQGANRQPDSNFGSIVDIAAPGTAILSTVNSGTTTPLAGAGMTYGRKTGTSMATPLVAAVAALAWAARPELTVLELETLLRATVTPFPARSSCRTTLATCGAGIVNAGRAVGRLLGDTSAPVGGTATFAATGSGAVTSPDGLVHLDLANARDTETGVAEVEVAVDEGDWRRLANTSKVDVDVTDVTRGGSPEPGNRTIRVRWVNGAGLASEPVVLAVDYRAAPSAAMTALPTLSSTRSLSIRWSVAARAPAATITGVDVRYRRAPWNGGFGAWAMLASGTQEPGLDMTAHPGTTYCFAVRARDSRGTVSAWSAATCTGVPLDDRRLWRSASWTSQILQASTGDTYLVSRTRFAVLRRPDVRARVVGVVARTCPTCGTIDVLWNGALLKRISLRSPTTAWRAFVAATFATPRHGTLTVRVASSGRPVRIDALVVRRN